MKNEDKLKKDIMHLLDRGDLPTTTISLRLSVGYYKVIRALEQLEKDGKIYSYSKTRSTAWSKGNRTTMQEEVSK